MSALLDDAVALSSLASGQRGLVTTAQAAKVGVPRGALSKLANKGLLDRVSHGVYAFAACDDIHQTVRSEWLALAPDVFAADRLRDLSLGVVSHTSAATVQGLGDFLEPYSEFTLPARRQTRRQIWIHRGELGKDDVMVFDGMLVTTPERTVTDLVADHRDLEHVSRVVRDALRSGQSSVSSIAENLEGIAPTRGYVDGKDLVGHLMEIAGIGADGIFSPGIAHV